MDKQRIKTFVDKVFGDMAGEDVLTWEGYLNAHRRRRRDFAALGATATDHGHAIATVILGNLQVGLVGLLEGGGCVELLLVGAHAEEFGIARPVVLQLDGHDC